MRRIARGGNRTAAQDMKADFRERWLACAVVLGIVVTILTEALTLRNALGFIPLAIAWAVAAVLAVHVGRRCGVLKLHRSSAAGRPFLRFRISLACLAVILGATAVVAILAPPNNWDSMTYHMPRVMHWQQNGSVAHYPTSILRQLHQSPWAEFAILHLQILTGGDRFANLVQWLCMLGALVGVSGIAKRLGGDPRAQVLAAVVCATIPMGILQSVTTQNDYVVAFWLVCFASYSLAIVGGELAWQKSLLAGSSLGLAILTKGTAYVFAAPWVVWLSFVSLRRHRWRGLKHLAMIAVTVLTLNAGHLERNWRLYGSVLGPGAEGYQYNADIPSARYKYTNDVLSLRVLGSNVLRNVSVHLGTPSFRINKLVEHQILRVHEVFGIDASDPGTTFGDHEFAIARLSTSEDYAGNSLHLLLIVGTLLAVVRHKRWRSNVSCIAYVMILCTSFLLFSLLLKWQPFHSRLQLPLFVMFSPVVGLALAELPRARMVNGMPVVLLVAAAPWLFYAHGRALIGSDSIFSRSRVDQYFAKNDVVRQDYSDAASTVRSLGCSSVGLHMNGGDYEYGLWVLLRAGDSPLHLEHVAVRNVSARGATGGQFRPCAVLVTRSLGDDGLQVHGQDYERIATYSSIAVYAPM